MAHSSAEPSASVIFIADDRGWIDAVAQSVAQSVNRSAAGKESAMGSAAESVRALSWAEFDESSTLLAATGGIALAYLAPADVPLDWRLGHLCRMFPKGVVVELSQHLTAPDEQFFAYGFRKFVASAGKSDKRLLDWQELRRHSRCFEYQLTNYKAVPDWLNARFWAHPERFDL